MSDPLHNPLNSVFSQDVCNRYVSSVGTRPTVFPFYAFDVSEQNAEPFAKALKFLLVKELTNADPQPQSLEEIAPLLQKVGCNQWTAACVGHSALLLGVFETLIERGQSEHIGYRVRQLCAKAQMMCALTVLEFSTSETHDNGQSKTFHEFRRLKNHGVEMFTNLLPVDAGAMRSVHENDYQFWADWFERYSTVIECARTTEKSLKRSGMSDHDRDAPILTIGGLQLARCDDPTFFLRMGGTEAF